MELQMNSSPSHRLPNTPHLNNWTRSQKPTEEIGFMLSSLLFCFNRGKGQTGEHWGTNLKVELSCRVAGTCFWLFTRRITAEFVEASRKGEKWQDREGGGVVGEHRGC